MKLPRTIWSPFNAELRTCRDMTIDNSPEFEVTIEVSRWAFVKRGYLGKVDFVSPLPCLYNYGAIWAYRGLDGDFLDALVLGPRLRRGTKIKVRAYGAIGMMDRGRYDDKLICSAVPLSQAQRKMVLIFFHAYALYKRALNVIRHHRGPTTCEGWCDIDSALARARIRNSEKSGLALVRG